MSDSVYLKRAKTKDFRVLKELCSRLYSRYFADYWENDGLSRYLEHQFGTKNLHDDLKNPSIGYYFIMNRMQTAGFIKVNLRTVTARFGDRSVAEIEKFYLNPTLLRSGIGGKALEQIFETLQELKINHVILEVLDTNVGAIKFYKKFGFRIHSRKIVTEPGFKKHLNGLLIMIHPLSV